MNDTTKFVSKGTAHVSVTPGSRALDVTFVLLPKFTMLAFSAVIEPLRMANQLTGQVLFRWQVMSGDAAPVACSDGVAVMAEGRWPDARPEAIIFVVSGVEPEGKASTATGCAASGGGGAPWGACAPAPMLWPQRAS